MFGTLKPGLCGMTEPETYRRAYCGMCKSLGTRFGLPYRAMVNHDVVLYATVVDALMARGGEAGRCRCPLMPVRQREILVPDSVAMRCAAAIQMLLARAWLGDKEIDGNPLAGRVSPVLSKPARMARGLLAELGLEPSDFDALIRAQQRVERAGATPTDAAEPTAVLLGNLMRRIANLPEASPELRDHETRRALFAMGHALGRVVYLVDAVRDLPRDLKRGHFNPCIRNGAMDGVCVTTVLDDLRAALGDLERVVGVIPFARHRVTVEHVLIRQLPHETARAARKLARRIPALAGIVDRFIAGLGSGKGRHLAGRRKKRGWCPDWCCCADCCCESIFICNCDREEEP